jgi:exosortase
MSQAPALETARPNPGAISRTLLSRVRAPSLQAWSWLKDPVGRQVLVVAGQFALLFRFNLVRLWNRTNPFTGDPNWGHAFFVPLIGLLYLFLNRQSLRKTPVRHAWSGLPVLLAGIGIFLLATWPGQNDYCQDIGMLVTLFGIVLLWVGWGVMRVAWFPLVFLLCAIPWPESFYNWLAAPLQRLAAHVAVATLSGTGVDAEQIGTRIYVYGAADLPRVLNVAEACSGLRSLVTFVTLGTAVAFLVRRPLWQRIVITVSAVPIAVFCNVVRVAGQGLLDHYVSQRLSEGFYHEFVGIFMFIPGFLLILLVARFCERLFIEDEQHERHRSHARVEPAIDTPPVPAEKPGPSPRPASKRWHPAIVTMVLVLGLSACGLGAATRFLHVAFSKLPVALARPLETIPGRLGPWQQVGRDQVLDTGVEETLGTRQYVMRDYVDTRLVDAGMLGRLSGGADKDREAAWTQLRASSPQAVVNASVTYYTGTVEKMSHIPEVCYPADGFESSEHEVATWPIGGRDIEVRLIQFEDQTKSARPTRNVAYFFQVNGTYKSDSWAVRGQLHSLFEKHNYFAKVELMTMVGDRAEAAGVMKDFLSSALPEIEKCLPDWQQVRRSEGR